MSCKITTMEENYLTKAEEQIMQILWVLEKGYVKDIIERLPEPKPAYNTVSTIVRILESKGYVGHVAIGKSHEYFPLLARTDYTRKYFKTFLNNYFGSSFKQFVSFFAAEKDINPQEMEELLKFIQDNTKTGNNFKK